jgi:ubiquinone/menaquinone biosynthesis C-methylase UbiE
MTNSKTYGYVTAEYLKKIAEKQGRKVKQASYKLLNIRKNSHVLDIGCGPGIDTINFSEHIGTKGQIVGLDNDHGMIEKANAELKKHKTTKNVKHIVGDVQSMPFTNSEFDRVHAERLFQVLPKTVNPLSVFAEMHRVLKTGGIMVLVDTDWATASVNYSNHELERRLVNFFAANMRPNGYAGRQLLEMLANNGYREIKLQVMPMVTRNFAETPFGNWLTTEATKAKAASEEEMARWRKELEEKTARHTFLSHVNVILTAGLKAAP